MAKQKDQYFSLLLSLVASEPQSDEELSVITRLPHSDDGNCVAMTGRFLREDGGCGPDFEGDQNME